MEAPPGVHVLGLAHKARRRRQRRAGDGQQHREASPRACRGPCILRGTGACQCHLVEHPCAAALVGPPQPPPHGRQELQHGLLHRESDGMMRLQRSIGAAVREWFGFYGALNYKVVVVVVGGWGDGHDRSPFSLLLFACGCLARPMELLLCVVVFQLTEWGEDDGWSDWFS
ncbi:hypothetical protein BHE74_00025304 [Ensete ventricosum]|nr:hypothetical protein BHE74_00025304 [Ensete ventricosum]